MTALAAPDPAQRLRALRLANDTRSGRAEVKAQLADGSLRLEDVLRDPAPCVAEMLVYEVLECVPRIGRERCSTILRRTEVWPLRQVGRLTAGQRERLASEVATSDRGLRRADCRILDHLALDGGPALGRDIAEAVGVSPLAIGSRLVSLADRGYVQAHPRRRPPRNAWTLAPGARPWR